MKKLLTLPLLALALLVGACDSGPTEPKHVSAAGSWSGTSSGITVNLTLSETAKTINGSGNLQGGSGSIAVTVTGTNAYPNVSMTLASPGYEAMNFQGTFTNPTTISGAVNGSGFNSFALTLNKR